jgi:signal transduction histidine kinase
LVRRILFNLAFNAAKYAPPDSEIRISGSLDWEALEVRLSVADQGPGIPRKYRKMIFDKYVQAEARSRGDIKSKGLGLTFCRLAVEAHDGRIWVESEEGQGSLFHFTLPIVVPGAGGG